MFLRQSDFTNLISQDHLNQVIGNRPQSLIDGMNEAQKEIESYLRGKFDLSAIFKSYENFSPATTYATPGEYVWHEDKLYTNTEAVTQGSATPPALPWSERDPRDAKLKQVFKDVTLYHLHSAISPRNIPELRILRYKDAIQWLKDVRDGGLSTDLPKVEEPNFRPHVISQPRNNWHY